MALFCATVRRDSVSLLRFPFLSHIQVFFYEMSLVYRSKYSYSFFSSHFCFLAIVVLLILVLFVLFLVAVISISLLFLCSLIEVSTLSSMLADPLPPSFLEPYTLFISALGCKALCIVMHIYPTPPLG